MEKLTLSCRKHWSVSSRISIQWIAPKLLWSLHNSVNYWRLVTVAEIIRLLLRIFSHFRFCLAFFQHSSDLVTWIGKTLELHHLLTTWGRVEMWPRLVADYLKWNVAYQTSFPLRDDSSIAQIAIPESSWSCVRKKLSHRKKYFSFVCCKHCCKHSKKKISTTKVDRRWLAAGTSCSNPASKELFLKLR